MSSVIVFEQRSKPGSMSGQFFCSCTRLMQGSNSCSLREERPRSWGLMWLASVCEIIIIRRRFHCIGRSFLLSARWAEGEHRPTMISKEARNAVRGMRLCPLSSQRDHQQLSTSLGMGLTWIHEEARKAFRGIHEQPVTKG